MRPYFDGGGVTIYHGDCREVLPTLKRQSAHLIVTDPPYGVNWQSGARKKKFKKMRGDEDRTVGAAGIGLALKVLVQNRHAYFFGKWNFDQIDGSTSEPAELIWDKTSPGLGASAYRWAKQHEHIQFVVRRSSGSTQKGNLSARLRKGSVLRFQRPLGTAVRHPSEKPVALLRELIESSSRIGETVLDPFLGSGSTAIACLREDRMCVGIEVEEQWCELAVKRVREVLGA